MQSAAYIALFLCLAFAAFQLTRYRPAWGLCALIAAAPFNLSTTMFHTTFTSSKAVLGGMTIACFVIARPLLREVLRTKVLLALCVLVLCNAVTIVHALLPGEVLRETLKQCEYLLTFVVAYCCFRSDPQRRALRHFIEIITAVTALCALTQEITGAPSVFRGAYGLVPRIAGPLEGPNQLAGFFDVTITWIFAQILLERSPQQRRSNMVMALSIVALFLTFSRGGIIAIIAAAIVELAYTNSLLSLESLFLGSAAVSAFAIDVLLARGAGHLFSFVDAGDTGSVGHRSQLWRAAFFFWRTHPFFGIGAGNYEFRLAEAGYPALRSHANSLFFQALAEGGLQLLAATVWNIYAVFSSLITRIRRSPLALGACAATLALTIHQTVDFLVFYPKIATMWWIVVGIAVSEQRESDAAY